MFNTSEVKAKFAACPNQLPADKLDKVVAFASLQTPQISGTFITNLLALLQQDGPGAVKLVTELIALFGL